MSYGQAKQGKASASDEWTTDPKLVAAILAEYGAIILDAAATAENAVAPRFITKEMDALEMDWQVVAGDGPGIAFCNPPYSAPNKPRFTEKAIATAEAGLTVAMVLPCNTRDRWFHSLVLSRVVGCPLFEDKLGGLWPAKRIGSPAATLWLLEGQVRFGSPLNPKGNGAPVGVAVVVFKALRPTSAGSAASHRAGGSPVTSAGDSLDEVPR